MIGSPEEYKEIQLFDLEGDASNRDFYNKLLRGTTHKLNNQIAVIDGFSSLMKMTDHLDPSLVENLDHIKTASTSAASLGERILSAGGCTRVQPQIVKTADYVAGMRADLIFPFEQAGIHVQVNVSEGLPDIQTDPSRLKDALLETMRNAAEAAGPDGEAALDVVGPAQGGPGGQGWVDIIIRNTGELIPKEKLEIIFTPFFSSKDSTHFGLGLTIAAMLLTQLGARIRIKSDEQMTTLWMSVPVA
ncbi:MAG: HAMP domain-containing sensor histidine kinase [Verrucomicrobiota bacterium]